MSLKNRHLKSLSKLEMNEGCKKTVSDRRQTIRYWKVRLLRKENWWGCRWHSFLKISDVLEDTLWLFYPWRSGCLAMTILIIHHYCKGTHLRVISVQFSSVAQSCPTLCDPVNFSMPGLPVHHQLPEFTQTHVHEVCDAIQPSHPLSSPSPPAPNPSQHQSLFQWVNSLHEVAKVLEFQL